MHENNDFNEEKGVSDYKVLCFDGEPKLIELHQGRFTEHTQDFYDVDWNKLAIDQVGETMSETAVSRPELLDDLLDKSAKLSQNIAHLRVDWYCVDGKLYFGELTFYDGAGFCAFCNCEHDMEIGNLIHLPEM